MTLRAHEVSFGYGATRVLERVSVELIEGEVLGLVGPNGAGKSTLLRCLHGQLRPNEGSITLDGRDLREHTRREIARAVGVVPQDVHPAFPVPVEHFVGMGRFAHESVWGGSSRADREVVRRCMDEMGVSRFAERATDELSGGEFRRVLIAQALAQEPRILLFDEPIQQLDLEHQLDVMEFVRAFARRGGTSTAVVLHDLSLAARYCDRLAVMQAGRIVAVGAPEAVLTEELLRCVWGVRASIERCAATGALLVTPIERGIATQGHESPRGESTVRTEEPLS